MDMAKRLERCTGDGGTNQWLLKDRMVQSESEIPITYTWGSAAWPRFSRCDMADSKLSLNIEAVRAAR